MIDIIDIFKNMSLEAKKILSILQKNEPMTKSKLIEITQMKLTTLNRIMNPLEKDKIIMEFSLGESTGGRKPALYDVDNRKYGLIGIDISRMYTQVVFTDLKMNLLYKQRFDMNSSFSPEKTVDKIKEICKEAVEFKNIKGRNILGVGLGTVGPLDMKAGIMKSPANFTAEGWTGVPLKEMLEKSLGLKVYMDNGANVAALVEYLFGCGRGFKNIAYFNCGIGIRTAAMSEGNIIRTINDAEDAFGHMVINVDGEKCNCGNFGCIECYASIASITKKFKAEIKKGRKTKIQKQIEDIDYIDICAAAEVGDAISIEVIKAAAEVFGTGLANFVNLLNTELVVLSGPLVMQSDLFYKVSIEVADKKYYLNKGGRVFFNRGGHFKENVISIGAAAIFIENLLKI